METIDTEELARRIRIHAVKMVNKGGSSHIGSVLSMVDILAVLYGNIMNYKAKEPKWSGRDRFILSKGHAGAGVYAVLAECGFFDVKELDKHYKNGSIFSGHVSHKGIPGVEFSTGALGHGLPVAAGIALRAKLDEGSNWEAFMFSAHRTLNNLCVIIDRNNLQSMDTTENTLALEPLAEKIKSFGWHVQELDGHSHVALEDALIKSYKKPLCIIANTVKGKGVSYMENSIEWHYKTPKDSQFEQAISELEKL